MPTNSPRSLQIRRDALALCREAVEALPATDPQRSEALAMIEAACSLLSRGSIRIPDAAFDLIERTLSAAKVKRSDVTRAIKAAKAAT
jgi:hypothetical protein